MTRPDYDPMSLSEIDRVEIVVIHRMSGILAATDVGDFGLSFRCEAEVAEAVAVAWRALIPGRSARCHGPPFGFRFLSNEKLVMSASVCWRCNNIYGDAESDRLCYAFDSTSEAATSCLS